MNNKCMLLVSSCDAYEDTWEPMFKMLSIMWPDMPYNVVLNTESKEFKYPNFNIITYKLFDGKRDRWSKRLKQTLQRINTEYVFFVMDDFFPLEKVEQSRVDQCIKWLDDNPDVSSFSFRPCDEKNNLLIFDDRFDGFVQKDRKCNYKLCCNAAIWRRKDYIKYLRNHEDPWQFEVWGSKRAHRYKKRFYTIKSNVKSVYVYDVIGPGICSGKWNLGTEEYFDKYKIDIDFTKRGFNGENPYLTTRVKPYNLRERFKSDFYKPIFWQNLRKRIDYKVDIIRSLL